MGACTVGGGTPVLVWLGLTPSPLLLPYTLSPLDAVFIIQFMDEGAGGREGLGAGGVISPVGEQHQAWGVKEILKTTHSSHQNKSGRIKGTQICPFLPGEGEEVE